MPPTADGSRHRARIMESARDVKDKAHKDRVHIKFKCLVNNDFEEVVAYNDLVDFTEKDTTWEGIWTFDKKRRQGLSRSRCELSCSLECRRTNMGATMRQEWQIRSLDR